MATLTVRGLDEKVYEGLKRLAEAQGVSMEAEARDILDQEVARRRRWAVASLADLSGDATLADIDPPFVRSDDEPRRTTFE
ncbi:MAG: hypothetical protein LBK42_11025 [Propionibacteriaceae bacterium]|jgi:plasmid stability protein|nr:hypothetical protein [Propionibacteriaceae bacterium]